MEICLRCVADAVGGCGHRPHDGGELGDRIRTAGAAAVQPIVEDRPSKITPRTLLLHVSDDPCRDIERGIDPLAVW